jgi:hypothetical protein
VRFVVRRAAVEPRTISSGLNTIARTFRNGLTPLSGILLLG